MRVAIFILLLLSSVSSAKERSLAIEADFMPYVAGLKKFYRLYNGENLILGKLSISRGELFNVVLGINPDTAGECHRGSKIIIGPWLNYGECQKEELITHEMGHCLFGMTHDWGGFMEAKMHSESECKVNLESLRSHFYKAAKVMRDWRKKKINKNHFEIVEVGNDEDE